jgi:hypothetical protein
VETEDLSKCDDIAYGGRGERGDEERETNNGLLMIAEIHFKKKKKI